MTRKIIHSAGRATLALGLAAMASAAAAAPACPATTPYPAGLTVVTAVRVFTGPSGESEFAVVTVPSESKAYFKPGEMFTHADLGAATKVQLVAGPANAKLPLHVTPGREMFLTIQGSSTVVLPNGREREVTPGTLVIFDDMTSKTGHGGRTGPCGYVAINIVPAP